MKHFVSFSNCQGGAVIHFLKKTRMAEEYRFTQMNNWQQIVLEQSHDELYSAIATADVLLYQPTGEMMCQDGYVVESSDVLIRRYVSDETLKISFSYVFNMGLFPLLNVTPGPDGWITAALLKQKAWAPASIQSNGRDILRDYNAGLLHFDCARRFLECLAEQSRREQTTDIKMVPWILANYRKQRLFLTQNHLTSAVFTQLAFQVLDRVYEGKWLLGSDPWCDDIKKPYDENEAQMNGVMPVHQAVVDELGLEYPATEGAHEYYRDLLEKMIAGK